MSFDPTTAGPPRAADVPAGLPRPGSVFADKYRLTEVLGQGGMGVVLGGEHMQLQQPVAIKFLLPHIAAIPGTLDRFLHEARAVARIQGEHAVRILDVGESDGIAYMIMERLTGLDLEALSQGRGPLPVDETASYVFQACSAIAEAHAVGIVHRDLKPANLFLAERADGSSIVKVLDFGISKTMSAGVSSLTAPNAPIGSPPYMSPEQVTDSRSVDARSDVWSLGVILFELLTRAQPFVGASIPHLFTQILAADPRRPRDLRPGLPVEMEDVILACLARDPAARIPDAAALARRLEPFLPFPVASGGPSSGARSVRPPIARGLRVASASPRTELAATLSPPDSAALTPAPTRGPRRGAFVAGGVIAAALMGAGFLRVVGAVAPTSPTTAASALAAPNPTGDDDTRALGAPGSAVAPASPATGPTEAHVASVPPPARSAAAEASSASAVPTPVRRNTRRPAAAPSATQPVPSVAPTAPSRVRDLTAIKPLE